MSFQHTPSQVIFFAALIAAGIGSASADLIPPGNHGVTHQILITGITVSPECEFYIYPTSMSGGIQHVVEGVPLNFYKFAGPHLYAFSAENVRDWGPPPEAAFQDPAAIRSSMQFRIIDSLPDSDPTQIIVTTYRVGRIVGTDLQVHLVSETHNGVPVSPPIHAGLSLLLPPLAGGLLLIRRRQGRSESRA